MTNVMRAIDNYMRILRPSGALPRIAKPLMLALGALLAVGCNADDEQVFKDGTGNIETKPEATLLSQALDPGGKGGLNATPEEAADITYKITVTSNSGAKLCKGTINLVLMSNFSLEFPEAYASCSSMRLNLEGMLAGGIGADGQGGGGGFLEGDGGDLPISHDGKMLYLEEVAGTSFSPARPMLLGPIVTNNDKYDGYKNKVKTTATKADGTSDSGTFSVTVEEHDAKYENDFMKENSAEPFENVIHWIMTAEGFDGFAMSDGLIVEHMEFYWNTNPIMIPEITIKGEMGSLIGEQGGGGADIVGKVTITLQVADYTLAD